MYNIANKDANQKKICNQQIYCWTWIWKKIWADQKQKRYKGRKDYCQSIIRCITLQNNFCMHHRTKTSHLFVDVNYVWTKKNEKKLRSFPYVRQGKSQERMIVAEQKAKWILWHIRQSLKRLQSLENRNLPLPITTNNSVSWNTCVFSNVLK